MSVAGNRDTSRAPVFAWLAGEDVNIGDSLLRRPYLAALAERGDVHAWVKNVSPAYLTGLIGSREVRVSRSFAAWFLRALWSSLTRRTVIALNAGEVRPSVKRTAMMAVVSCVARLSRRHDGRLIWVGATVRAGGSQLARALVRFSAQAADILQWRSLAGRAVTGLGDVGPDWAFVEGSETVSWSTSVRDSLALVLRGDRAAPSDEWIDWVRGLLESLQLEAVVVVQVKHDADRAFDLAQLLGGRLIDWPDGRSHSEQEAVVRAVYRGSLLALGDRLHGLVVAATEGAVPIGWVESSRGKIAEHFSPVGLQFVGSLEGSSAGDLPPLSRADLRAWSDEVSRAVEEARGHLASAQSLISATVGGACSQPG